MHHCKNIGGLALVAILAACTDNTSPPAPAAAAPAAPKPAPVVHTAEQLNDMLMMAVFGPQFRAKTKDAVAELNNPGSEAKASYRVEALKHSVLATGETVLLARSQSTDPKEAENGQDRWLGVYFLRQESGKWRLVRRHDNVTLLDRDSEGAVSWVKLGKGKEGIAVLWSAKWDACSDEGMTLYDLGDPALHQLSGKISTRSSATGDECNRAYSDSRWSVEGKWRLATPKKAASFDDLVIDFSGQIASPPHDTTTGKAIGPLVTSKVNGTARYAYDAKLKQYQLVEGENLIPQDPDDYDG